MNISKIRTAPNAEFANKILPKEAAIIQQGPRLWAFTVRGELQASGITFDEAKAAAVNYYKARS